jgi:prevent-host-death family protein
MKTMTATEVARHLSEVLDKVERRGETFVVVRKGRAVARIGPAAAADGRKVKEILRSHPRDPAWSAQLRQLRAEVAVEERRWNA